jgi:hypothetical protein
MFYVGQVVKNIYLNSVDVIKSIRYGDNEGYPITTVRNTTYSKEGVYFSEIIVKPDISPFINTKYNRLKYANI